MTTTIAPEACPDPEFRAALVRLYPDLLRRAERLTGNPPDARDLLHDAIERGIRQRDLFRSGSTPDRWMATILHRLFIDRYRLARRRARYEMVDADTVADHRGDEPVERWQAFSMDDLRRAVAALGPRFRDVYALYAFEGCTHDQIATRLGLRVGTVATRIMRARGKLQPLLERQREARDGNVVVPLTRARRTREVAPRASSVATLRQAAL